MNLLSKIRTLVRVRPLPEGDLPEVAQNVAIIMDGNGRWAKRRGLPTALGHRAGTRALRRTVESAIDLGVHNLVVYAFSTENWSRPQDEVDALMEIFGETIERELPDLAEQGVRVRFIGRRDRAPDALRARMEAMEDRTELNSRLGLWIAFDYGGRAELVRAARRIAESGMEPREIDENVVAQHLYAPELPDPDLLIRTSGELRVSNFMLWQLAYAELVFVDRLWPDFDERDLRGALAEYARRRRRFGGRYNGGTVSNLVSRLLVVAIALPIVLGAVYLGGWWLFVLLVPAALIALHEFWLLARPLSPLEPAGYVGGMLAVLGAQIGDIGWMVGGAMTALVLAFVLKGVAETRQAATASISATVMGAVWIGCGLGFTVLLRDLPEDGRLAAFTVLLAVWAGDTLAYVGGRLLGRHRMAPHVSPGKTWEGFAFGTAATIFVTFVALYDQHFLAIWESIVLGAVLAVAAPLGDLFESMLKRDMQVKDTGTLLGGHGGMLDRIDALLFAVPAAYFCILAFGHA